MFRRIVRTPGILAKFAWILLAICAGPLAGGPASAAAVALDPVLVEFIDELAADEQYSRNQLRGWFARASVQHGVLKAIARPTTALPWHEFRASHVTEARIRGGVAYWEQHAGTLARASVEYGVPEELIVATIGIESFYGRRTGTSRVFDSLYTLAFHYPPRAALFRAELKEFLLMARELQFDPLQSKGSYAGALGVPQFLPSSFRRHAIDFDHDGKRDLWNHSDAIGSVANYYKAHGWRPGEPVLAAIEQQTEAPNDEFRRILERGLLPHTTAGAIRRAGGSSVSVSAEDMPAAAFGAETEAGTRYWVGFNNFYVITRYNRSVNYALAVHELAQNLRESRRAQRFE